MQAGRMKYRITLLMPVRTVDRMGAEMVTYTDMGEVHAERVKISGGRSDEVGEHFPYYRVEFNIRDAHTVGENWRVSEGGYTYNVLAVVPNFDRGYNTLVCERVNE